MGFRAEDFFLEAVHPISGLELAYNMEENPILSNTIDTTKIRDLSGNGRHGDINGTTDVVGVLGRAREFNGISDYIGLAEHLINDDMTLIAHVRLTSPWVNDLRMILSNSFWGEGDDRVGFHLGINANGTAFCRFQWGTVGQGKIKTLSTTTDLEDGEIHSIQAVKEGTEMRLLVDDDEEVTRNDLPASVSGLLTAESTTVGTLSSLGRYFPGMIDEPNILSRPLTSTEQSAFHEYGSLFSIPNYRIQSWSLEESDQDLLDVSNLRIWNSGGEFNDHLGPDATGIEVKVYLRREGDTETKWIWTGIVKTPLLSHSRIRGEILQVSLGDYVYEILSQRQIFDSFTDKDSAQILKDVVESKCPEIDTSQIVLSAKNATLAANGIYVKDLGFKLARHAGYQLGGDYLKRILFFPVGTDDSGIPVDDQDVDNVDVGPDDEAIANVVRVQGGEGTAIISENLSQTAWTNISATIRKLQKILTPKRKIKNVEIWTDPTRTGSGDLIVVRIQADDGTGSAPSDEDDATKDLARKALDVSFLATNGFTTFLLPDHILGAGNEYWIIVESEGEAVTQYERPDADISVGLWIATPLWSKLDEITPSDSDFIRSRGDNMTCELRLTDVVDPLSSSGHTIRVRARRLLSANNVLTVKLFDGGTEIASYNTSLGGAFVTSPYTLTTGEADSIGDYTDLRIKLITINNLGPDEEIQVSWVEFEVPSVPVGQDVGIDGSSDLTYKSRFAYPIIEVVENKTSIDSPLGRREIDLTDTTILSKEEAKDRAKIEIAKRAFAERVLSFDVRESSLLDIRPGQGSAISLPDLGIDGEKFILHKRRWELEDAILDVSMDLVEEERLVESADVIKNILERLSKVERIQAQITGEDIIDVFKFDKDEYQFQDVGQLTVDVVSGMIWGTDAWGFEVWSRRK